MALTVAITVKVAVEPTFNVPIVQFGAVQVPVEGVALTSVYPLGMASVTTTLFPLEGPLLEAVTVKVTFCPIGGVALLLVFVTTKSLQPTNVTFIVFAQLLAVKSNPY